MPCPACIVTLRLCISISGKNVLLSGFIFHARSCHLLLLSVRRKRKHGQNCCICMLCKLTEWRQPVQSVAGLPRSPIHLSVSPLQTGSGTQTTKILTSPLYFISRMDDHVRAPSCRQWARRHGSRSYSRRSPGACAQTVASEGKTVFDISHMVALDSGGPSAMDFRDGCLQRWRTLLAAFGWRCERSRTKRGPSSARLAKIDPRKPKFPYLVPRSPNP